MAAVFGPAVSQQFGGIGRLLLVAGALSLVSWPLMARYVAPGEWTLVVSSKDRLHYEPSAKLAEAPMEVQDGKDPTEDLSIQLSNKGGRGVIEIAWGGYRLVATFAPAK